MSDNSAIEWTDATWNPIRARNIKTGKVGWHCEHATTGCEFCYAEGFNKRLGTGLVFKPGHRQEIEIFLDEVMLTQPLRWKKPRMIFVCSMTDLFAEFVPNEMIDKMFAVMALAPQHTLQVLTKRAERMSRYVSDESAPFRIARVIVDMLMADKTMKVGDDWPVKSLGDDIDMPDDITLHNWPLPNVWLGVSAERQEEADERIPPLLQTPAAVRFISAEPLLGPIDLIAIFARFQDDPLAKRLCAVPLGRQLLDWVIVGGESGPKARPMHPDWARDLREQCEAAGVAFFFKQWGEWAPGECANKPMTRTERCATWFNDEWTYESITPRVSQETHTDDAPDVYRLGKKAAGRLLDGELHNAMPVRSA